MKKHLLNQNVLWIKHSRKQKNQDIYICRYQQKNDLFKVCIMVITSATALKEVLLPSCSLCFAIASAATLADLAISSVNSRLFLPSSLFWASSRPCKN